MAKSSLDKMKERLKKSSPKISGRANLQNMNQIRNFIFGKSKKMGTEDDVQGISLQKAKKKIADSKKKTTPNKKPFGKSPGALGGKIKTATKDKVDIGLSKALKKKKNKKTTLGKSPGALGGKVTPTVKKDKKVIKVAPKTDTKSKVKATAANTKDFASTMAMQKRLIKMGANIKADGLMGAKTRAAMKKFLSKPSVPTKKTTMNVSANKNKNAGIDEARGDMIPRKIKINKSSNSKLDSKGNYKGTNIKPTKLQLERMNKR